MSSWLEDVEVVETVELFRLNSAGVEVNDGDFPLTNIVLLTDVDSVIENTIDKNFSVLLLYVIS